MQKSENNKACGNIIERYCYEIGENVVLKSVSPDNLKYECVYSSICKSKDNCIRNNSKDKK